MPDYGYHLGPYPTDAQVVAAVFAVVFLIALAIALVFYIFHSIGLYTLAKRRGIRNPGLAWVPIGSSWILGCLADQHDSKTRAKQSKQRHILLWLQIAILVVAVAAIAILCVWVFSATDLFPLPPRWPDVTAFEHLTLHPSYFFPVLGCYFLIVVLSIIYTVFMYIALYKLYKSCDSNTAIVFLLLSIFITVTMPFLVFAGRNKDDERIQ